MLDWVCQIAGKTWAPEAVIDGLVRALDDLLSPQATRSVFDRYRIVTPDDLTEAGAKLTAAMQDQPRGKVEARFSKVVELAR